MQSLVDGERVSHMGVNGTARRLLPVIADFPLGSVNDYSVLACLAKSTIYPALWHLEQRGLVAMETMGASRPRAARWWLTPLSLEVLGLHGLVWHHDSALAALLPRLSAVEWFYPLVASMDEYGPLRSFQWFASVSWDAVARFDRAWVAFFWSGLLQTETRLRERFSRLVDDIDAHSVGLGPAWPALLFFVAADSWQRELVFRVARSFNLADRVRICDATDGSVSGALSSGVSDGWVYQAPSLRGMGGWSWERRLQDSLWTTAPGGGSDRALSAVAEWPGIHSGLGRRLFAESGQSKYFVRLLRTLAQGGYVQRMAGKLPRYGVNNRGYAILADRDSVANSYVLPGVRLPSEASDRRLRRHQEGLFGVVGSFAETGDAVAAGWRSLDVMPEAGIYPDAMVRLSDSPYGPGWAYLEYERSVRGQYRARRKLRSYLSGYRRDRWPLLLVLWDEAVEALVHRLAAAGGLPLLTSTVERVERGPVVGVDHCWSMYGLNVHVS